MQIDDKIPFYRCSPIWAVSIYGEKMEKAARFCSHPGCSNMSVANGYCNEHQDDVITKNKEADRRRGSAGVRGYGWRWQKYSRAFLRRPENQFCSLRLPGCTFIAQCVDHIDPPDGPDDPRFWDKNNHQPACIHCNSVKGHRKIVGSYKVFGNDEDKAE